MALTMKDVENRGLLNELASSFSTQEAAQVLLAKLEFPAGRLRPFGSMETRFWWRHVCEQLDRGIIANGLERLLRAAAAEFPANPLFAEYQAGDAPSEDVTQQQDPPEPARNDPPAKGLHIFLSYAREDLAKVTTLYATLKQNGYRPWMDEMDLLPGQVWRTAIRKEIRETDVFLVLLSRHSSKRGFVQKEIRLGLEAWEETPEDDIFLIPALLEPTDIPERLREIQAVKLYEESGLQRLIEALSLQKQ